MVVVATVACAWAVVVLAVAPPPTSVLASPLLGRLAVAAIVAGLVLGLDDPAGEMLAALPTSGRARLGHRLVVLSPVAATIVAVVDRPPLAHLAAPACALASVALLAFAASPRRFDPHGTMAAALPLAWVTWSAIAGDHAAAGLAGAWSTRPCAVTAVSSVTLALVTKRRAPI
jgi:hypothetical protein